MLVGVGYSDHPDSTFAGRQAAQLAMKQAGRQEPCDMVLLFCTARHNQALLREAVAEITGETARIYGGGAAGVITNDTFGYAGDQVGVACFWLDGVRCDVLMDGGLLQGEEATGRRLGAALAEAGVTQESAVMLFYDAVNRSRGDMQLLMATWLLEGVEKGLGFFPNLAGAGMQGDHVCSPTGQYIGEDIGEHYAMAMAFSQELHMDTAIMHGCRPASQYYTVTKAEGPVILEINGKPAIAFIDELLEGAIAPEEYPFFLLFGINHGEPWADYDENKYASRLCMGLDQERGGIVMFEPDMVAGTEFQLMFRSLELGYMKPKIEALFNRLDGREPVFAMYIDCAGRCAGYGGLDLEDAVVLQQVVNGRVPLLGLYTGVEIAPIGGRPRGLDWTGVFCLFSRNKAGEQPQKLSREAAAWESGGQRGASSDIPLDALLKLTEQNAAKVLALDTKSIAIRHELEQKRRGFRLLAELAVSLRQTSSYESVFIPVAKKINAALNMQKTAVLVRDKQGRYAPAVLQGYSAEERAQLAGQRLDMPEECLNPEAPVLVTADDSVERMAQLRATLMLPYFISCPVSVQGEIAAVLLTGRVTEQPPFLSRLGHNDVETVQAVGALLSSVLVRQRLDDSEEQAHIMLNAMPLCCVFWDASGKQIDCNEEALRLFGVPTKEAFLERFYTLAPEYQPDGRRSEETARELVLGAFISGAARYEWVYQTSGGELIPSEVTLVRVPRGEDYNMVGYIRDLREQQAAIAEISHARDLAQQNARAKSEFLAAISHEVRTPMNVILAAMRAVSKLDVDEQTNALIAQGERSARVLSAAIDSILDYSQVEDGDIELAQKPFAPRDIAKSIVNMLGKEAEEKSIALHTEVSPHLPAIVMGDAVRLEQAVYNLVANAIKFTDAGEVALRVYPQETCQTGRVLICFEVRDTGIGMSEEQQARIFEPLTAVDASYSRKQGGLGMGLALSRSLARLMEGEVVCQSAPGAGSTFTLSALLTLPAQEEEEAHQEADLAQLAGMRVLVAEDNPINQMIVEDILSAAGISVVTANNGIEALKALEEGPFDLVMMDIQMPEMDGLTAAAQIRADSRFDHMPILAMTANSAKEHRRESKASGMEDHLTKPIDVDEVYAALKRWYKRG